MAVGDIYRPRQQDLGTDVVGGRLDYSSDTSLIWNFLTSNQIRLFNPNTSRWEIVQCNISPTALNSVNDLCGNALTYDKIYDVFAIWSSRTTFTLGFAPWSSGTHGFYNLGTSTCTSTMVADNSPTPCIASADRTFSATYAAWKAFNASNSLETDSWMTDNTAHPHWLKYDFGPGRAVVVNSYAFLVRNNTHHYPPTTFRLQACNDNSNWIDLDTRSSILDPGLNTWSSYFTFKNSTPYRYYRLLITASIGSTNYCDVGELKLVQTSQLSSRYEPWVTGTAYKVGNRVQVSTTVYACILNHTAGTWATDLAYPRWVALTGIGDLIGLDILDGVPIYANSGIYKSYRWLGLVRLINNNGAKFVDSVNQRFVSNLYNRQLKAVWSYNSNTTWTYDTPVYRESNGGTGQVKGEFLLLDSDPLSASISTYTLFGSTPYISIASIGVNSNIVPGFTCAVIPVSLASGRLGSSGVISLNLGYNYITNLEYTNGLVTFGSQSGVLGNSCMNILA